MNEIEQDGLWDVEDAARYLKLKPFTIRKKVRQGLLPVVRIGRLMRFNPAAIKKWLAGSTVEPDTRYAGARGLRGGAR